MTSSLAFANDARIRALPFTRFFVFKKNTKNTANERSGRGVRKITKVNDPARVARRSHPANNGMGLIIGIKHMCKTSYRYLWVSIDLYKKCTDVLYMSVQNLKLLFFYRPNRRAGWITMQILHWTFVRLFEGPEYNSRCIHLLSYKKFFVICK